MRGRVDTMASHEDGDTVFAQFPDGAQVLEAFRDLVRRHKVQAGILLGGVGMLRDVRIGYYRRETRAYEEATLSEPRELLSYQGNVGEDATTGDPLLHLHVQLGAPDYRVRGGHLLEGRVWVTNEVAIRRLAGVRLVRRKNPETNLFELELRPV